MLLATPGDLEDFAVGFSLTEGIIDEASEIEEVLAIPHDDGVVLRIWLGRDRQDRLEARRRRLAGPAGCGLCGIESLAEAARAPARVSAEACFTPEQVEAAIASLRDHQPLGAKKRGVHAAGFGIQESEWWSFARMSAGITRLISSRARWPAWSVRPRRGSLC